MTLYIQLFLGGLGLELDDLKALRTWGRRPRATRSTPHRRRRDDDRAARSGRRATPSAWPWRPAAIHGHARPQRRRGQPLRPPHLRHVQRRRHRGGRRGEASIAGIQGLGNLTMIYDPNRISIEDDTDIALAEDVAHATSPTAGTCRPSTGPTTGRRTPRTYRRCTGDHRGRAGHGPAELHRPAHDHRVARAHSQGTEKIHGSALGEEEVAATKKILGLDPEQTFEIAAGRHRAHPQAVARGAARGPGTRSSRTGHQADPDPRCSTGSRPAPSRRAGRSAADVRRRPQGRRDPVASGKTINAIAT